MKQKHTLFSFFFATFMLLSFAIIPSMAQDEGLQPGLALALKNLPLREEAGNSDTVGTVQPGALVTVVEIDSPWVLVEYEDISGWGIVTSELINVAGPTPLPRAWHHMIYDSESDRVILFGGLLDLHVVYSDTWAFDPVTNTWEEMSPDVSPPAGEGTLAYDSESDRAILLLGVVSGSPMTAGQTWAYDYNTNTWTQMTPENAPFEFLRGTHMVYDSESDRIILHGGVDLEASDFANGNRVFRDETWAYDYNTDTWTQMAPASLPSGLYFQSMVYDSDVDRVILLGVDPEDENSSITWVYDYNTDTWEMQSSADNPVFRIVGAMVYAEGSGSILFGGTPGLGRDDEWVYDAEANTWAELESELTPPGRAEHAMVYISSTNQIMMFSGGPNRDNLLLDLWFYDLESGTWTSVAP